MKNPFIKQNNGLLAISIALGSMAAGAVAYLFLTEKGSGMRERLRGLFDINEQPHEYAMNYLERPHKAPKTDREKFQHHAVIVEHPGQ